MTEWRLTGRFGGPGLDAAPLIAALREFVDHPVRIQVGAAPADDWVRGTLVSATVPEGQILTIGTDVVIEVDDGRHLHALAVNVDVGGSLTWRCPRRWALTIQGAGRKLVVYDDRPITRMVRVETELAQALTEADPLQRHSALANLARVAGSMSEVEADDALRSRLVALSFFLADYTTA